LIGRVTAQMRQSLDVDTVLQTAVREMRQILDLANVEIRLGEAPAASETQSPAG